MVPECFACGEPAPNGLMICGQCLCAACEQKMMHSTVEQIDYQHWVDRCRSFWERLAIDLAAEEE